MTTTDPGWQETAAVQPESTPGIIAMEAVKSSQIASIGHSGNTMAVRFLGKGGNPGSLYHYQNVTRADFDAFRAAESIGLHFQAQFKKQPEKYPFIKVDEPSPFTEEAADVA